MTLCIAALATRNHPLHLAAPDPAVILSYDRRIQGSGASETAYKYRRLSKRWRGLFAGTVTDAHEALNRLEAHLGAHEDEITPLNVIDELWKPILEQQNALQTRGSREAVFEEELLLVGLIDRFFHIFRFWRWSGIDGIPKWEECEPFAAIGSGAPVAEAILHGRDDNSIRFVPAMLYRVYEAQRIGAIVPAVGTNAHIHMLYVENGEIKEKLNQTNDFPDELWRRFGFRPLIQDFEESDFTWTELA